MSYLPNISKRIKELMKENEINSEELSRIINVSSSVILRWTKKDTSLFLSNLIKLSDYFKCSIEYLSGRKNYEESWKSKPAPMFSIRLREVLSNKAISVYKIIKDTKLSSACFEKWFNGTEPTLSSLIILSDYLDCSIDFLVGREY